jgi:hypothetical protein
MKTLDYVSPMVNSLSNLLKNPDFQALSQLYDEEEKIIMRELIAAQDDRALRIVQGKAKMLKKIRTLPEETVDRYINDKTRGMK